MTENKKNKGWREPADPTCINKKGKPVARRHHNVAAKGEFQNTLRTPLFAPPKPGDEYLAEEIIEEVKSKRKPGAIARDNTITAAKVGDKEDPKDVAEWAKNPAKSDLKDVDDETDEPEETEEPEE